MRLSLFLLFALCCVLCGSASAADKLPGGPSQTADLAAFAPKSFAYVLQADRLAGGRVGAVQQFAGFDRDLIVMDQGFNTDAGGAWTPAEVAAIRTGKPGRRVVAYLSIGEAEDYRGYWQPAWDANKDGKPDAGAPAFLNTANPDWTGNYRVHYWHADWQKIILADVDKIVAQGFEGGDGSTVHDCYFESGDDIIKVYFDITVTDTTIKMVQNSVPIQLGWGNNLGVKHDPSLFQDGDTWWLLWQNTQIAPLSKDFSQFTAAPVRIDPAGSRTNSAGRVKSVIGHEGATMIKVGDKYVHLGTAWSTDETRKGSYNLYYCVSDKITGSYGPRQFVGRFLGHGTPFRTRDGKWWNTAFFNANVPPLPRKGIEQRDLAADAQTINQRGTTIVPLEVKALANGEIYIRAKDPAYATPGPDETQPFPR